MRLSQHQAHQGRPVRARHRETAFCADNHEVARLAERCRRRTHSSQPRLLQGFPRSSLRIAAIQVSGFKKPVTAP
jgi:hypothetical protein